MAKGNFVLVRIRFGRKMRESLIVHSVSPLVLMVLYMYVTLGTTEFKYSRVLYVHILIIYSQWRYKKLS